MPFTFAPGGGELPITRREAQAGTDVIDLAGMRAQLEADRARKRGGR